jgi:ATP-dependent DNA ligase
VALEKQEEGGRLGFCLWDVAFYDGECLLQTTATGHRFDLMDSLLLSDSTWFTVPETVQINFDERSFEVASRESHTNLIDLECDHEDPGIDIVNWAGERGWEGYVITDPEGTYGDRAYNFHGKPERPKFVGKLKPKFEGDFIVRWDPDNGIGKRGKGKKAVGVGSVQAYLWDPDKEEEVPICLVGGGLTDEDVTRFADPNLYPMVWKVEFGRWTPKGSLFHPEFLHERDDKRPEDCCIDQNPAWVDGRD